MGFRELIRNAIQRERQREFTKAFNLYKESLNFTQNPKTVLKVKNRQAWCQYHIGNTRETLNLFQELLDKFVGHPESHLHYANYLIKVHNYKSAKKILSKAIESFPDQLELYLTLASLLKDTDRSNEAITVLKQALSQEKLSRGRGIKRKDIWAELGYLYFQRGDYNSGLASLKTAMRMDEEETFLHYDMIAQCYLKVGDHKNALKFIDLYIKYFGESDADILVVKARAHSQLGESHLACASLLQAYSMENGLKLSAEDMVDFGPLLQTGFFDTLENVEIDEA
ncbi:tetratricopeptide repeat protein [Leptospira fluminis]|uniref:Tetratricopeptide repeat protein n=1 Tax=Leptospira fluminis TaxID=2484979 RepID=A0A4R9GLG1_9LEPT|nr:tetratricopeptide repeat protein [Leptospira fluminis]TGK15583.1 tetratricopeptide repeat protein [Leptospira fluminis]